MPVATLWFQGLCLELCSHFGPQSILVWQAPLLLTSLSPNSWQLVSFCGFCLYKPPLCFSLVEHNSIASWICVSKATIFSWAQIKPFSILLTDCLLFPSKTFTWLLWCLTHGNYSPNSAEQMGPKNRGQIFVSPQNQGRGFVGNASLSCLFRHRSPRDSFHFLCIGSHHKTFQIKYQPSISVALTKNKFHLWILRRTRAFLGCAQSSDEKSWGKREWGRGSWANPLPVLPWGL